MLQSPEYMVRRVLSSFYKVGHIFVINNFIKHCHGFGLFTRSLNALSTKLRKKTCHVLTRLLAGKLISGEFWNSSCALENILLFEGFQPIKVKVLLSLEIQHTKVQKNLMHLLLEWHMPILFHTITCYKMYCMKNIIYIGSTSWDIGWYRYP